MLFTPNGWFYKETTVNNLYKKTEILFSVAFMMPWIPQMVRARHIYKTYSFPMCLWAFIRVTLPYFCALVLSLLFNYSLNKLLFQRAPTENKR